LFWLLYTSLTQDCTISPRTYITAGLARNDRDPAVRMPHNPVVAASADMLPPGGFELADQIADLDGHETQVREGVLKSV